MEGGGNGVAPGSHARRGGIRPVLARSYWTPMANVANRHPAPTISPITAVFNRTDRTVSPIPGEFPPVDATGGALGGEATLGTGAFSSSRVSVAAGRPCRNSSKISTPSFFAMGYLLHGS